MTLLRLAYQSRLKNDEDEIRCSSRYKYKIYICVALAGIAKCKEIMLFRFVNENRSNI